METIAAALRRGATALDAAGVEGAAFEARLLLGHALGLDRAALLRDRDRPIDPAPFDALLARRAAREPLAFITGEAEFWSLPFAVSTETLIPRADSEAIVEAALAASGPMRRVLDLGTGTGCLLLAVLSERSEAWGLGTDRNPGAAALAALNARALGLAGRAVFAAADWAAPLVRPPGGFDLVLSNPPYIESAALPGLMPEVARWEPRRALDGGPDGLAAYRAILAALPGLLAPEGRAVFEIGEGQGPGLALLAAEAGFRTGFRPDLAGIPRAAILQKGLGTGRPRE